MGKKIDRTGEEGYNKFGSKMVITKYNGAKDMNVYFPEYNWTFEDAKYQNFQKGEVKCPYEPRYYGVGYLGEGKYKMSNNGKLKKNLIYGVVCCKDVMILNSMKNILHIKIA